MSSNSLTSRQQMPSGRSTTKYLSVPNYNELVETHFQQLQRDNEIHRESVRSLQAEMINKAFADLTLNSYNDFKPLEFNLDDPLDHDLKNELISNGYCVSQRVQYNSYTSHQPQYHLTISPSTRRDPLYLVKNYLGSYTTSWW